MKKKRGKEMSEMTYTDGSKTIWRCCTCGLTNCKCGAVKHYPHKADIELAENVKRRRLEWIESNS